MWQLRLCQQLNYGKKYYPAHAWFLGSFLT